VFDKFNMRDFKPVGTPLETHFNLSVDLCPYASTIGSLLYAMVCTRLDIAHSLGVVNRFLSNRGKQHWQEVKWILMYLRVTSHYCLCFGNNDVVLEYRDAYMVGDVDPRKSTTGYLYTFAGATMFLLSRL